MPDESFDYDEFVQREFENKGRNSHRLHWLWWAVATVLLAALALFWVAR